MECQTNLLVKCAKIPAFHVDMEHPFSIPEIPRMQRITLDTGTMVYFTAWAISTFLMALSTMECINKENLRDTHQNTASDKIHALLVPWMKMVQFLGPGLNRMVFTMDTFKTICQMDLEP